MPNTELLNREIMAVGKWNASTGKVDVTPAMLDEIVASYNALNSQVDGFAIPIKLGHNKTVGAPAFGYATNVRRDGPKLLADFTDMDPEIVDAIGAKRYNAVSVELWPKIEYAGKDFTNVLSGVALLGAEWPAVKGLKPVYASEFAAEGALMLSQEEDEMPNFTQEQHDAILASEIEKATKAAKDAFTAQVTELTAKVETAEQERDTAQAALAAISEDNEKRELTALITDAEKDGRIVPANKAKIEAFAESVRTAVKGDARKALMASFKDFMALLPKRVKFSEDGHSKNDKPGDDAPAQERVNAAVAELRKADKKLSYKDALAQVFADDPELKNAYAMETR